MNLRRGTAANKSRFLRRRRLRWALNELRLRSTLSKVLVGHPAYEVTGGSVRFKGRDLLAMEAEERSHEGLFLSFQSPVEIPGVRRAARAAARSALHVELA
jgi:hypothetical protein